jgi:membrane protein DedA with SNARE-associated domain
MLEQIFDWILEVTRAWGYPGIFFAMAIESTIIPLPSELVLIPAGYLVSKGEMNGSVVVACGAFGSLLGAAINYAVSLWLGRPIMERIGRYVLVTPDKLDAAERYFESHGEITTFIGRLLPGIRHLISIPAGIARMNFARFSLYTTIGAGVWSAVLVVLGYFVGASEDLWRPMLRQATLWLFAAIALVVVGYLVWHRRQVAARSGRPPAPGRSRSSSAARPRWRPHPATRAGCIGSCAACPTGRATHRRV